MAYLINRYNGQQLVVLEDGTVDISTSINLVGRNYTGYGELQNENFVFLLENFANNNPPPRPISGQIWYSTATKNLSVYDGTVWKSLGSAAVSDISPVESEGNLWLDSSTNKLYVFNGEWNLIGPEAVEGFGATKLRSRKVIDSLGNEHAISDIVVDNEIIAIVSKSEFTIGPESFTENFSLLKKGITFSSKVTGGVFDYQINGDVRGNADSATRLKNPRTINNVFFDGQQNITIKSSTTSTLTRGTYLTGSNFDGSLATTWEVDATPNNTIGKVVARDSSGGFSAGTITASFVGNLSGNVTASTGTSTFNVIEANEIIGATLSGNAATADIFKTTRKINGVDFNGSRDITITSSASTLTEDTLNSTVRFSALTTVGVLTNLRTSDNGATIGNNNILKIFVNDNEDPVMRSDVVEKSLTFEITDLSLAENTARVKFISSTTSLDIGGPSEPAVIPDSDAEYNLGIANHKWKNVHADLFIGTATTAQYADLAEKYTADAAYEPGTVLMFGGSAEVTLAESETKRVAGVVSTAPAYLMNSELHDTHVVPVALQGRVPCVVLGPIKKGDMLVSAGDGRAKAMENPQIGTVIGKALADFNGIQGVIEVVVGRL
jgi:hypothetical protein